MNKINIFILMFVVLFLWSADVFARCQAGDELEVLWNDRWYFAHSKGMDGDKCCIHYDSFSADYDECVSVDRIKMVGNVVDTMYTAYVEGDQVQVLWNGEWVDATVTKTGDDRYKWKVHYSGYGSNWDEWVGPDRIQK